MHTKNSSQLEENYTKESFVSIAGNSGVNLAEGRHYKALSSAESDKVWEARKRTPQRTVTASVCKEGATPSLQCTVAKDVEENGDEFATIDFSDLIRIDEDWTQLPKTVPPPPPALIPAIPPVIKTPAQVVPAPVELSIHASPGSSSSSSSSSSTSDTEAEKLELLRAIARGTEETARVARLQVDVMMTLNQNIITHNTLVRELHTLLKEMKTEKQP